MSSIPILYFLIVTVLQPLIVVNHFDSVIGIGNWDQIRLWWCYRFCSTTPDDSSNEQLIFQKTAFAVTYIEITNAATGDGPIISSEGEDDVDLNLNTKGTGSLNVNGDTWWQTASVQTTDATVTNIVAVVMASSSTHTFEVIGHGYEDATGDTLHFQIFGGARNEAGTSSALSASITKVNDAGASTWDVTVDADDTGDTWRIRATGQAAHTIDWTLRYRTIVTAGA